MKPDAKMNGERESGRNGGKERSRQRRERENEESEAGSAAQQTVGQCNKYDK